MSGHACADWLDSPGHGAGPLISRGGLPASRSHSMYARFQGGDLPAPVRAS